MKKILSGIIVVSMLLSFTGCAKTNIEHKSENEEMQGFCVADGSPFELTFDIEMDEFISRYNQAMDNYLAEAKDDGTLKSMFDEYGAYLDSSNMEKVDPNEFGENGNLQFVLNEQLGMYSAVTISTYNDKVSSIIIMTSSDEFMIFQAPLMMGAAMVATDPEQDLLVTEAAPIAMKWLKERGDGIRKEAISSFENNILFVTNILDESIVFTIHPMSENGYEHWNEQISEKNNSGENTLEYDGTINQVDKLTDEQITEWLEMIKKLSLWEYPSATVEALLGIIGATTWELTEFRLTSEELCGFKLSISGNGMTFIVDCVINTNGGSTIYISGGNINGVNVSGDNTTMDPLVESLLDSAYETIRAYQSAGLDPMQNIRTTNRISREKGQGDTSVLTFDEAVNKANKIEDEIILGRIDGHTISLNNVLDDMLPADNFEFELTENGSVVATYVGPCRRAFNADCTEYGQLQLCFNLTDGTCEICSESSDSIFTQGFFEQYAQAMLNEQREAIIPEVPEVDEFKDENFISNSKDVPVTNAGGTIERPDTSHMQYDDLYQLYYDPSRGMYYDPSTNTFMEITEVINQYFENNPTSFDNDTNSPEPYVEESPEPEIYVPEPPVLSIGYYPTMSSSDWATITGRISNYGATDASVTANGMQASFKGSSGYWEVTVALVEGENEITVIAENSLGETAEETVVINR